MQQMRCFKGLFFGKKLFLIYFGHRITLTFLNYLNMRKKILLSGLFLIFCFLQSIAQQKTISGKVTDASTGQPLAGSTISVRGSKEATQTNSDGSFTISVPNSATRLIVSSVGF